MFKFFRKIRKNLISQGKTAKYIKYALGEIVLVMIGILLALQVNNWNEIRKSRQAKSTYIERLINDLKSDSIAFSLNIENMQSKVKNGRYIMSIIDDKQTISDKKEFILSLQRVGRYLIVKVRSNTFLDLQNSGNLKLFNNDSIVDALRDYYFDEYEFWNTMYVNRVSEGFLPIVTDILPFGITEAIMNSEKKAGLEIAFNEDFEKYDLSISDADIALILKKIEGHDTFNFHLKNAVRAHMVNTSADQHIIDRATTLIKLLENLKNETNKH